MVERNEQFCLHFSAAIEQIVAQIPGRNAPEALKGLRFKCIREETEKGEAIWTG